MPNTRLPELIARHERDLLNDWLALESEALSARRDRISESQLRSSSREFLSVLTEALSRDPGRDIRGSAWQKTRDFLADLSRQRAAQGFTPSETATFVFSLKQPLFTRLRAEWANDPAALADEIWTSTDLLDKLGLYTMEVFQKTREDVISRQQQEMLELSTPVVELLERLIGIAVDRNTR